MSDNVVGISGATVAPVTGIVGATIGIGQYIINDYVITIAEIQGGYGYTMTITKGTDVQTVTLYGLTQAQYDDMIGYLEQAQAAAQSASSDASAAAASMRSASSSATVAIQSATRAETAENSAKNYQNNALSYSNAAKGYRDEAATQRSLAQTARAAAETAQGAAESAQIAAETAQAAAQTAATNAGASATSAAGSASAASQSATDAAASAAAAAQTLTSVQAEGAAQIAAIDAEGQEVLESIPEDYTALEGDVADLKSQTDSISDFVGYASSEQIDIIDTRVNKTANGITFTWDNTSCAISGTATADAFNNLIVVDTFPYGIAPGDTLNLKTTISAGIGIRVYWRPSSAGLPSADYYSNTNIIVPTGANGCVFRIQVASGSTVNGTIEPHIYYAHNSVPERFNRVKHNITAYTVADVPTDVIGTLFMDNGDLYRDYGNTIQQSKTTLSDEIVQTKGAASMAIDANIVPLYFRHSNQTGNGITLTWTDHAHVHVVGTATALFFCNMYISRQKNLHCLQPGQEILIKLTNALSGCRLRLYWYENGSATMSGSVYIYGGATYFTIPKSATGLMLRFEVVSGTQMPASGVDIGIEVIPYPRQKHIKILCIGNSYTNDNTAYTPMLMEGLSSDISITMGTSYYSGAKISQYLDWFDDDSAVLTYYKYGGLSKVWDSGAENKTLKEIIADEDWDVITFQQGSTQQGDWSTFSDLNTLIDRVVTYNATLHDKSVKIGWLAPQLRLSIISTTTYESVINCIQSLLSTTPIDFIIPCVTAVQNARGTTLNDIGASGGLTADANGHLQAGLPSLLGSYTSSLKLLEICGITYRGILGEGTRPTQDWITAHNTPGENGTSVGVTDDNCLLAQKCAIAAIKKPYEVTSGIV